MFVCSLTGNSISDEGVRALAESLKKNTTLITLNLNCMLTLHEYYL